MTYLFISTFALFAVLSLLAVCGELLGLSKAALTTATAFASAVGFGLFSAYFINLSLKDL